MDLSLCCFHYIDHTKNGHRKYRKAFSHAARMFAPLASITWGPFSRFLRIGRWTGYIPLFLRTPGHTLHCSRPSVFVIKTGGLEIFWKFFFVSYGTFSDHKLHGTHSYSTTWLFQNCHSFSLAWQSALWAAMVARVSPSCINRALMRLISSVFSPQAMVFAKAVTAAVRLQAFISDHPFPSEYARRGRNGT